jgi:hypothetical protein
MVAEYYINLKSLIEKLNEGIISIYIGVSNKYNVKIIIA